MARPGLLESCASVCYSTISLAALQRWLGCIMYFIHPFWLNDIVDDKFILVLDLVGFGSCLDRSRCSVCCFQIFLSDEAAVIWLILPRTGSEVLNIIVPCCLHWRTLTEFLKFCVQRFVRILDHFEHVWKAHKRPQTLYNWWSNQSQLQRTNWTHAECCDQPLLLRIVPTVIQLMQVSLKICYHCSLAKHEVGLLVTGCWSPQKLRSTAMEKMWLLVRWMCGNLGDVVIEPHPLHVHRRMCRARGENHGKLNQ